MNFRKKISQLLRKMGGIGPMLPGSISKQYNVCGKLHCQCKDPDNPIKHGPYYQLSYTVAGRSSSMFVKHPDLPAVKEMVAKYKRFKELFTKLTGVYLELARSEGISETTAFVPVSEHDEQIRELAKTNSELEHAINALRARCAKWRTKATTRTKSIESCRVKVRDLEESRNNWKEKTRQAQATIRELEEEAHQVQNKGVEGSKKKSN